MSLAAPFPYYGGKSTIAAAVWQRFGDVPTFVEPFFGSGAVLLARPHDPQIETVNDADGLVANFWRAVQADPHAVAHWCDRPVNENDLHAIHSWLVARKDTLAPRLEGDPDFFDAKIAGWWVWGICSWIGSGWCSGIGPWHSVDGTLQRDAPIGAGAWRQLPHLGDAGRGINRQLPHLGDAGRGINRQLPHLGDAGRGQCAQWSEHLRETMQALADRLRRVRVCCGDWSRVCGPSPTIHVAEPCGVFLDPPYADTAGRDSSLYRVEDLSVAHDVRRWAIEHGDDPRLRIALCGYDTEHAMPESWECLHWKARGGYAGQGDGSNVNAHRERVWFSPHCLTAERAQLSLWEEETA